MKRTKALWASTSAPGGISAFVGAMEESSLWEEWNIRFVSTHANGKLAFRVWKFAKAFCGFVAQLALNRPGIVHLHVSHYGSFYRKSVLAWTAKAFRVPVVLHIHGSRFHLFVSNASRASQFFIRLTLHRADALVALGDVWADRLRTIAPRAKIVVVPNAVRPGIAVSQDDGRPVRFVFLGEIGDRKGTFILLDAWARMLVEAGEETPARLTIAGDGEVDRAKRMVKEFHLETTVDVHGWMPKSEVRQLLASAKVLVLPSRNEGQPMAILEAMAQGLCVIATNVGGIPEMLRDGCGILVDSDNVDQLASAMAFVIADSVARASYGGKAIQRIENEFNIEVLSQRLSELYRSIAT